ncbi:MAG: TauD/TfdA family dioxygenase, partial [Hyphomicrobiales bacterium]
MSAEPTATNREPLTGRFAWAGADIAASNAWIRALDPGALATIDAALARFESTGAPWHAANRDTFPLAPLTPLFDDIRDELENGCGFVRLTGLPVERYSLDQLKTIYFALGEHLGTPVSQSVKGERMLGLTDEGSAAAKRGALDATSGDRPFLASRARAYSTGELRFHTDRCDVVTLLCVRRAKRGGVSRVASAVAIHNAMLARRPDLLECLFQDYPRSRFGEEVTDASAHYMLPVFALSGTKFTTHYSRTYIEAAQSNPQVPQLSAPQVEALDLLAELGNELSLEMTLEPGDIQLLNNHVIYHARTPYEDHD